MAFMSAIDFDFPTMDASRTEGLTVLRSPCRQVPPYKYYGAEQGLPEYGFKEE